MYNVTDTINLHEVFDRVDTQRELVHEQLDLLKTLQQPASRRGHRA